MQRIHLRNALCFIGLCFVPSAAWSVAPTAASVTPQSPAKPAPPLSQRFADDSAEEVPDFQKHVVPLLGRLGCNGRACHGSFQGRGGFQLSLFGYDFQADHKALLDEATGRVDIDDIDESLILAKPLDADMHEGGKRFDSGSWQHHVLRRWIQAGAKYRNEVQSLERLELIPNEIRFREKDESASLRAVAHWRDGTVEDVTQLCRYSSNDDSIAEVDDSGHIRSGERGDTHVIVYYDNAVVPVPVLRPFQSGVTKPQTFASPIDRLVRVKLENLGVVPSRRCTDAEFIRRVSLDMTGILPSADDVREFLADTSSDKRARLIDQLLDSPGYAAWWATRFSDWTGNSEEQLKNVLPVRNTASRLWYEWLRKRIDENVPYDELVEGIVTAQSREGTESYQEYCELMTKACIQGNEDLFASRDGMPLFWARRNFQKNEERAIGFAYAFLGIRIECAQCHKHPFDQWSKDDFDQFAKLFTPIRARQNQVSRESKSERDELLKMITGGKKLNGGDLRRKMYEAAENGITVPFGELVIDTRLATAQAKKAQRRSKKNGKALPPLNIPKGTILGQGEQLSLDQDPREPLMQWLRSPENPYFAKAIANRVWSNYFGIGIVDPSDDMNLANPPSNAPLLDYLGQAFIEHDFDMKWLHREIANSETYQRSAETNSTNVLDQTNFARHVPRRLPAEVIYDAVVLATGSDAIAESMRMELDEMAIAEGRPRNRNQQDYALQVFGQSIRETNCDCDRSDAPSLLQSIYLRNDSEIHKRLSDSKGWVSQACEQLGVAGPSVASGANAKANKNRAEARRSQFVRRIEQYRKIPEAKQKSLRKKLGSDYARLAKKMKQSGYSVPPLERLIADPKSWKLDSPEEETLPLQKSTIEPIIVDAYLRTLSRFPDNDEIEVSRSFIQESKTPADGLQSLMWALVNTKEFIITH